MTKDYSGDDWALDPTLANIGQSARRELRDQAREHERHIERAELQSRILDDVLHESRNRGDTVSVSTSRRTFNGLIERAAIDFLSVRGPTTVVDIAFAAVDFIRVINRGTSRGGTPATHAADSFAHHLSENESAHERVEIGINGREEILLARVPIVGQDHVMAVDDHRNEWIIPLTSISFVIRQEAANNKRGYR